MPEIRRVSVPEAAAVAELWDRVGREIPDGGPLSDAGRRNDVWTIRHRTPADDHWDQELFAGLGFEADMVCLSLYREGPNEC